MQQLPAPFAAFAPYRQFIVCQFVPDADKPGKTHKYPLHPLTGARHDAHDPSIWVSYEQAQAVVNSWGPGFGVGFVFTANDPFWFIDADNCLLPDGSGWTPIVAELAIALPGAAVEISQSGQGLHMFGTGSVPENRRIKDATGKLFDLYTDKRFVALTGWSAYGDASTDCTPGLHALTAKHLRRDDTLGVQSAGWTEAPREAWRGPTDDLVLLSRALQSQSGAAAFGMRCTFAALWTADASELGKFYPPDRAGDAYNASEADSGLAQHLAFWTGADCDRIKRLMLQSGLRREKWEREDYLFNTILNCCARQYDVLYDKPPEPVAATLAAPNDGTTPSAEPPRPHLVTGGTFLGIADQIEIFQGCVYVVDADRVLVPGGSLLKPAQFRSVYGGYTFAMDGANERTSRDAFEAFTQSQAFRAPKADGTCFKPNFAPGALVRDAGQTRANTWWPVNTPRQVGDVEPFLHHLRLLIPNERDREIVLSYMCACVQFKGYKFQWCPLIQGAPGNGKTLLTRAVSFAVGRRYCHMPPAHEISEKFNSWLFGTVFIGVEDIYVPNSRQEILEILKPMITSDELAKRAMQSDQVMMDVVCNFLMNSNHKNGLPKSADDRRIAPIFTAQQSAEDIEMCGMGGEYFPRLYAWLRGGGYAIISELLHTRPIPPEFNPCLEFGLCHRAPTTSSTSEAIAASLGGVEQEILERIERAEPGFAGGWVSSLALDRLIEAMRAETRLPRNRRRELLRALGYDWHPHLPEGRVNNIVMPDGGKPKLYIHKANPARFLTHAADIAATYTAAQTVTVTA